jgi:uncharacterized protein Yka (UPF0111/DUF47 family)
LISIRLPSFFKKGAQVAIRNVLAHVRVLAPAVPLEKLIEDAKSQEYLNVVERAEPEVDELAEKLAEQLSIHLPPLDDSV